MATESEGTEAKNSPILGAVPQPLFGHIKLDISNSVLPAEKLKETPSEKDGLSKEDEFQIRSFGCELIQLAGKLLKLPQVKNLFYPSFPRRFFLTAFSSNLFF